MSLLDGINSPKDLKKLTINEIQQLADEIREFVIETVSHTGGHLAPNLGVVELTLAIHRSFDSPVDKIIWDVGHQAYIHKILTGRKKHLATLRQFGGISGFPKRSESIHDAFDTGHSSTSISAALGMALARDLSGNKHHIVSIIGDGSLTGGMAWEALNYAGDLGKNLIVVLNDNEMSIAKNVGAMAEYLYRMRTAPSYSRIKRDVEILLRRIPAIGDRVAKTAERVKDTLKYLFVPGMLFEELGYTYIGPIDGHNVAQMEDVFAKAKLLNGPILIHALTCKGKGYLPAENNADKFHGVGPFNITTGQCIKLDDRPTYTSVFGKTLVELAAKDKQIIAITAAMPDGTGLSLFANTFPDRFFDVGIAEQHAVTMAAGIAAEGKKPVVAIYSTFAQRAYDQILHDICLQRLPVILALDRGGVVGEDGPTHHGVFDYSYLRHIPNLICMSPKDENELRNMMNTALNSNEPVAIRYPRGCGLGVPLQSELQMIDIGQAEQLLDGTDVAIIAIGSMVDTALNTARLLAKEGIQVRVINARFLKPLDNNIIRQAARDIGKIVTIEENVLAGGFGSAVLETLSSQNMFWVKTLCLGIPDKFIEHGSREILLEKYGLTAEKIKSTIREFLREHGAK